MLASDWCALFMLASDWLVGGVRVRVAGLKVTRALVFSKRVNLRSFV